MELKQMEPWERHAMAVCKGYPGQDCPVCGRVDPEKLGGRDCCILWHMKIMPEWWSLYDRERERVRAANA